jgi:hypothetical protein
MLFKKSKPWIRFYSLEKGVADLYPIKPSSSFRRDWMRTTSTTDDPEQTYTQNCPGIKLMTGAGYTLCAPADFSIHTNGDGSSFQWQEPTKFSHEKDDNPSYVNHHNEVQTIPTLDNKQDTLHTVIKLDTPWRFECSDDIMLLQMPFTYNNESRFVAAHGVIDPRYAHVLNVQLYWKVLNGTTYVEAGTPLVQYIPVQRSWLNASGIDLDVTDATEKDIDVEKRFNYCMSSSFHRKDSLKSRLQRVRNILNKYKHRR